MFKSHSDTSFQATSNFGHKCIHHAWSHLHSECNRLHTTKKINELDRKTTKLL